LDAIIHADKQAGIRQTLPVRLANEHLKFSTSAETAHRIQLPLPQVAILPPAPSSIRSSLNGTVAKAF
jgi:hypothetical protein